MKRRNLRLSLLFAVVAVLCMAVKVTDLPELTSGFAENDVWMLVDVDVDQTKKITLSKLRDAVVNADSVDTTAIDWGVGANQVHLGELVGDQELPAVEFDISSTTLILPADVIDFDDIADSLAPEAGTTIVGADSIASAGYPAFAIGFESGGGFIFEGDNANDFETLLSLAEPTADRTLTLPDASGELTALGQTIGSAEIEGGAVTGAKLERLTIEFVISTPVGLASGDGGITQNRRHAGSSSKSRMMTLDSAGDRVATTLTINLFSDAFSTTTEPSTSIQGGGTLPATSAASGAFNNSPGLNSLTAGNAFRAECAGAAAGATSVIISLEIDPS